MWRICKDFVRFTRIFDDVRFHFTFDRVFIGTKARLLCEKLHVADNFFENV